MALPLPTNLKISLRYELVKSNDIEIRTISLQLEQYKLTYIHARQHLIYVHA